MKKPVRLSILASLLLGSGVLAVGLLPGMGHAEAPTTRLYTVESRASLYQLALQSGLTVRELRKLNKGLGSRDTLEAGESLLLPSTSPLFPVDPLAGKALVSDLPELGMGNDPVPTGDVGAQKTAGVAQSVAAQDWNNMTGDQVKSQAESWAKNQAKAQVVDPLRQQAQEMLGKFGKAEVNIAVDDQGDLSKSSFSLFSPWYETDDKVAFSQVGIHDQDGRTIGNVGLGMRFDQGNWLMGVNTFLDQDISRNHSRLGVGGELWMDNAKLATNYYLPLSGWKDSKDFDDYLERAAEGWDVRFQGYLPAYPQLGASVVYEQYYGEEVALFGKDHLQEDPNAVTLGLDYTPFPLATLKVDHKMGNDGEDESHVELQVNYQIGTPLDKQLDPDNVAAQRSLLGSRYDSVDRNYDIVLEYKDKAILDVDLKPVPATLMEGDRHLMEPLVNSKYAITGVTWNGDTGPLQILATAGSNSAQGWQITLPAWDSTPGASNRYTLSLTVVNEKGKQSTSNAVDILVGQSRQGVLVVENGENKPASGLDGDVMTLSTHLQDHLGQAINDAQLTPRWIVKDAVTGALVPLVTGATCPVDAQGTPLPCLRVVREQVDVRNGINHYVEGLVSTLAGTFIVTTDLGAYGVTNPQTVTFTDVTKGAVARAEIQDPAGQDLLTTGNHPQVGVTYTVKLFDANNVDITATLSAANLRWMLDGPNTAGCNITLNSHDTGVTGYTFTPRTNANSNSGVACGDQGFGLKVDYSS